MTLAMAWTFRTRHSINGKIHADRGPDGLTTRNLTPEHSGEQQAIRQRRPQHQKQAAQ